MRRLGRSLTSLAVAVLVLVAGWTGLSAGTRDAVAMQFGAATASALTAIVDTVYFYDPVDSTKRARIDVGSVTAGQTRVITMPDANVDFGTWAGIWNGLYAEVVDHAKTDRFTNSSLDVKWAEWDPDTNLTVSEGATRLKLTQTSQAAFAMAGLYQTVPANAQYDITAALSSSSEMAGDTFVFGVFVAEDVAGSPSTANYQSVGMTIRATEVDTEVLHGTAYTNVTVQKTVEDWGWSGRIFLRIFVDNTANEFKFLASQDGKAWTSITTVAQASSNVSGDPVTMGVYINNITTTFGASVFCDMFRVDATSDPYLPVGGYIQ